MARIVGTTCISSCCIWATQHQSTEQNKGLLHGVW